MILLPMGVTREHIFEHSLTEIEELQLELEGKPVEKSKTKRKKEGVFYTPRYIIFKEFSIDASHVAIGGFSDGASYALCIGLTNGDLFTHVIAFSPGFVYTNEKHGRPAVFISHGTDDNILPITSCSRRIVPQLVKQNYSVNKEFTGGHDIPAEIAKEAVHWFL